MLGHDLVGPLEPWPMAIRRKSWKLNSGGLEAAELRPSISHFNDSLLFSSSMPLSVSFEDMCVRSVPKL